MADAVVEVEARPPGRSARSGAAPPQSCKTVLHSWGWNMCVSPPCSHLGLVSPFAACLSHPRAPPHAPHSNGQLGTGDLTTRINPVPVKFMIPVDIVTVATGNRFTLAVDSDGRLWTWGK